MTARLFSILDDLHINHQTMEHPPLHTEDDAAVWESKIPGLMCKTLFLHDKKGRFWLLVMPAHKRANLRGLEPLLNAKRISFASPETMQSVLGVTPGTATPFAVMNDKEHLVQVVLDNDIFERGLMNCHPLRNTASTSLAPADLVKFLEHLGYKPSVMICAADTREGLKQDRSSNGLNL